MNPSSVPHLIIKTTYIEPLYLFLEDLHKFLTSEAFFITEFFSHSPTFSYFHISALYLAQAGFLTFYLLIL